MATFNNGKKVCAILNFPTEKEKEAYPSNVQRLFNLGSVYSILHDGDEKENGLQKTEHAHVYVFGEEGHSSNTWIDMLALNFGVPRNCISIETTRNELGAIRYLMHLDENADKKRYPRENVITNNVEDLDKAIKALRGLNSTTPSELRNCETLEDLITLVGVRNANSIRGLWKDLREEADMKNHWERQSRQSTEALLNLQNGLETLLYTYGPSIPRREIENLLKATINEGNIGLAVDVKGQNYNNDIGPFSGKNRKEDL